MSDLSILVGTDHTAMDAPNVPTATSPTAPSGPGVVSTGWLAATTTFETAAERKKLGVGLVASLTLHGLLVAVIILLVAVGPSETSKIPEQFIKLVYVQAPGPGGGAEAVRLPRLPSLSRFRSTPRPRRLRWCRPRQYPYRRPRLRN